MQNNNKKNKKIFPKPIDKCPGIWYNKVETKEGKVNQMTTFTLASNFTRQYRNNGQHMEQWVRYTLTGETAKADNLEHDKGADCLGYQIKSARATVCKGTDIRAYLATDKATAYIYATLDGVAYEMTKTEYIEFVEMFGTVTTESTKNGGAKKIRLKHETPALLTYLAQRA